MSANYMNNGMSTHRDYMQELNNYLGEYKFQAKDSWFYREQFNNEIVRLHLLIKAQFEEFWEYLLFRIHEGLEKYCNRTHTSNWNHAVFQRITKEGTRVYLIELTLIHRILRQMERHKEIRVESNSTFFSNYSYRKYREIDNDYKVRLQIKY